MITMFINVRSLLCFWREINFRDNTNIWTQVLNLNCIW